MQISVIIPVYNTASKLERCLDSLLTQDFQDFQVILINDGSTDDSGIICDTYSKKDKRFFVLHNQNEGVSSARNKGIELANGKFICFIDSDDEVSSYYLKNLLDDFYKDENVDLVFQGVNRIKNTIKISSTSISDGIVQASNYNELFVHYEISLNGNPVSKLFKTAIIRENDLWFNSSFCYNEDKIFILEYILFCKKNIVFSSTINYSYYINSGSLTKTLLQPIDYFKPYNYFKKLIKEQFKVDYTKPEYTILYTNFKIYLHMYMNSIFVHEKDNEINYLSEMDVEDWEIYKHISKTNSTLSRRVFDFFLLKKLYFIPRLIAKYFIKPHFINKI
jgi:glycosyltransferase involved in cell wall biosynthesis